MKPAQQMNVLLDTNTDLEQKSEEKITFVLPKSPAIFLLAGAELYLLKHKLLGGSRNRRLVKLLLVTTFFSS